MKTIILVDDDLLFIKVLSQVLVDNNFEVFSFNSYNDCLNSNQINKASIFLLDYKLPDGNGIDLMNSLKLKNKSAGFILMTSFHDVKTAVKAMHSGAFDFITKPIIPDELIYRINELLKEQSQNINNESSSRKVKFNFVKGISIASKKIWEHVDIVAPTDFTVIIQGESGTGKENIAKSIHDLSQRNSKPFIAVDCGSLSNELANSELFGHKKGAFTGALTDKKGVFELADSGSVFLDELGNLSLEIQMKLLRAIQERKIQVLGSDKSIDVDIRIIAATNEDLFSKVKAGEFREDLYHRLNEFKILVPPLRDRRDDLVEFCNFFIDETNKSLNKSVKTIDQDLLDFFNLYEWPGNLRELRNVIRRLVLLSKGNSLQMKDLPEEMFNFSQANKSSYSSGNLIKENQAEIERELIKETLLKVKFNKSKAASILGIDRKTLYSKMDKYGIDG